MKSIYALIPAILVILCAGCASEKYNPSFPVSLEQGHEATVKLQADPRPIQRPLVIISGYADPLVGAPLMAAYFHSLTKDVTIIVVPVGFSGSVDEYRQKLIAAVDQTVPSNDPVWTAPVDVIGMSLGGVIARYAAAPSRDQHQTRRLNIVQLFTISSPHRGATLADEMGFTDLHRDVKTGSEFLRYLAQCDAAAKYKLICYVHLNDEIVGEQNAAPPGQIPYWLPADPAISQHGAAMLDERIFADIALHLRGETPLIKPPATPLPD